MFSFKFVMWQTEMSPFKELLEPFVLFFNIVLQQSLFKLPPSQIIIAVLSPPPEVLLLSNHVSTSDTGTYHFKHGKKENVSAKCKSCQGSLIPPCVNKRRLMTSERSMNTDGSLPLDQRSHTRKLLIFSWPDLSLYLYCLFVTGMAAIRFAVGT